MGIGSTYEGQPGCANAPWLALAVYMRVWRLSFNLRGDDVIASRVVRAPRQGLSSSRGASRRPFGARDAPETRFGMDAGWARSIKAIEALAVCGRKTEQGSSLAH